MMKSVFNKKIHFFLYVIGAWLFCNTIRANDCPGTPLDCGTFDIQIQGGVCPIIFHAVQPSSLSASQFFSTSTAVLTLFKGPSFGKLFHVPWSVGMQIGYAYTDNVRIYGEINYLQAQGKKEVSIESQTAPSVQSLISPHRFHLVDAYVGGRYYSERYCDYLAGFFGAKLGFTNHFSTDIDIVIANTPIDSIFTDVPFFKKRFFVSGGINGGLDLCFCNNWAFVLTAEIIFSAAPRLTEDLILNPIIFSRFTTLSVGSLNAEFRFPITAGIRYSF